MLGLLVLLFVTSVRCQIGGFDYYDAFDSPGNSYKGKYIGELSTFHHQVNFKNIYILNCLNYI